MPPGRGGAPKAAEVGPGLDWPIEVVRFAKIGGPLTKKISRMPLMARFSAMLANA